MDQPRNPLDDASVLVAFFPTAAEVYAVGAFNNWSTTASPMRADGRGNWSIQLPGHAHGGGVGYFVYERGRSFGRFVDVNARPRTCQQVNTSALLVPAYRCDPPVTMGAFPPSLSINTRRIEYDTRHDGDQ